MADISGMNQFVMSLSKSLQSLCHGCVDFTNGIEMIGYINISIDSENSVDCVLNEKVKKGSTNSLTFSSNSFLAKKEQKIGKRDASCSPIADLVTTAPISRSNVDNSDLSFRKRHVFEVDNQAISVSKNSKRHRRGYAIQHWYHQATQSDPQENTFPEPSSSAPFIKQKANEDNLCSYTSSHPHTSQPAIDEKSELDVLNIKQEVSEGSSLVDLSTPAIKIEISPAIKTETTESVSENDNFSTENDGDQSHSNNLSSEDHFANIASYELEQNQASSEISSNQSASTSNSQGFKYNSNDHAVNSENGDHAHCSPQSVTGAEHPSFFEQAEEGASNIDHFDVIEIGDDDDDEVNDLFNQSDDSHLLESHERGDQPDVHYSQASFHVLSNDPNIYGESFERDDWQNVYDTYSSRQTSSSRLVGSSASLHRNSKRRGQGFPSHFLSRNVESKYKCHHCSVAFESRHFLRRHMQGNHQAELPFTCRLCGKGFLSKTGLKHHELAHSGRNFPCHVCDQRFNQNSHLTGHLKSIHHLKLCYSCSKCIKLEVFNQHVLSCGLTK